MEVSMETRDPVEEVIAFYGHILPEGSLLITDTSESSSNLFVGRIEHSDDKNGLSIDIKKIPEGARIHWLITYKEEFDRDLWRIWPQFLGNHLRNVPWSEYTGSEEVTSLLGSNVYPGSRMVHSFPPDSSSGNYSTTFATNGDWDGVIAFYTDKFGPHMPNGKDIYFRGDIGDGYQATIVAYSPALLDPFHTILLDYRVYKEEI